MTAAVEGDKWSAARPGRTLPPENTRYPFYRRLGGPQGWSRRAENLVPTRIRRRSVQNVFSWATRPTLVNITQIKIKVNYKKVKYINVKFISKHLGVLSTDFSEAEIQGVDTLHEWTDIAITRGGNIACYLNIGEH